MSDKNTEILQRLWDREGGLEALNSAVDKCEADDTGSWEPVEDDLERSASPTNVCHDKLAFHMKPVPEFARVDFRTATSAANLSVVADTLMSSSLGSVAFCMNVECSRKRT